MEKSYNISSEIELIINQITEQSLLSFCTEVLSESNLTEPLASISYLNEFTGCGKRGIIYKFIYSYQHISHKGIPLMALLLKGAYKLNFNDYDSISRNINKSYYDDMNSSLLRYTGSNKIILELRYLVMYINILYLLHSRGGNIFFFIQSKEHSDYYTLIIDFLFDKYVEVLRNNLYIGFSPRVIFGQSIYTDILMFKYHNFNNNISNIQIYRLLHKVYNKCRTQSEDELKKILSDGLESDKNIGKDFVNVDMVNTLYTIIKNPYGSNLAFNELTAELINTYETKEDSTRNDVSNIIELFDFCPSDSIHFFILNEIINNKLDLFILYQTKKFELKLKIVDSISKDYTGESNPFFFEHKVLINNLNFLEQSPLIKKRKSKYDEIYKNISEKFIENGI